MGGFMVILHPRTRRQANRIYGYYLYGVLTPLRMPTNGLLRTAGLKPRCVARSVRTLPTQPSPPLAKIINDISLKSLTFQTGEKKKSVK